MLLVRTKLCIRLKSKREIDEGGGKKKDKNQKQSRSSWMTFWQSFGISIPILNVQSASFR